MIHQLGFLFCLLFSLFLFPSCTMFDSSDSEGTEEEEEYYEEEEGEAGEEEVEEESPYKSEEEESEAQEEAPLEGEENIHYIDEEDLMEVPEDSIENEESSPEDFNEEDFIEVPEDSIENEESSSENFDERENESKDKSPPGGPASFFREKPASPGMEAKDSTVKQKKPIPYKKIKSQPYQKKDFLVNAVYIARPGENIKAISNKIFGSNQVNQLYAVNPHLKARSVKVGDKIYYQSPRRPQSSNQILFYFEDNGIQPAYHQVQAGQNIRKVAKQLLGNTNSWKEIWATNPDLQSKWIVNKALTIRYWSKKTSAPSLPPSTETKSTPPPPIEEPEVLPEEDETESEIEEPEIEEPEVETPPPPSTVEEEDKVSEEKSPDPNLGSTSSSPGSPDGERPGRLSSFLQSSQMNVIVGVALAFVALICMIVIIRKRNKKQNFDYTATNFEIDE